ncbi:Tyrosine-protein kinase [Parasponia andersonii]|uniref:Tyrosine-protein kinase n=1 Tax=Parasponia andersonii TaxID=3476 RepID=A0A2P5D9P0_PARAD|nr:Tyrosine-protein kinase [Parasponia andersonii]
MVGRGGSSRVYRGCLSDGKELAVKILKPSEDVIKEFVQEIEIITALNHKNIISLFGFCFEDGNLLLRRVYCFLSTHGGCFLIKVSFMAVTCFLLFIGFLFVKANCTEKVAQNLWKRSHITITEKVAYNPHGEGRI